MSAFPSEIQFPLPQTGEKSTVISVEALTRRFGDFTAVNNISFNVRDGEIFGVLGPNGAGKSTTIKILCTLLHPTSGQVEVAGHDVNAKSDPVRAAIGVVLQDNSLDSAWLGCTNNDRWRILR